MKLRPRNYVGSRHSARRTAVRLEFRWRCAHDDKSELLESASGTLAGGPSRLPGLQRPIKAELFLDLAEGSFGWRRFHTNFGTLEHIAYVISTATSPVSARSNMQRSR